jgi:hypothetical protein
MATRVDTAGGVNEETLLLRAAKQNKNKNRDTIIVIDGIVNMVGAERQKERKRERERERERAKGVYKRRGKIQNDESCKSVSRKSRSYSSTVVICQKNKVCDEERLFLNATE